MKIVTSLYQKLTLSSGIVCIEKYEIGKLLSDATTFYDADMITGLINAMLCHTVRNSPMDRVTPA